LQVPFDLGGDPQHRAGTGVPGLPRRLRRHRVRFDERIGAKGQPSDRTR